jgi:hypothetical protein
MGVDRDFRCVPQLVDAMLPLIMTITHHTHMILCGMEEIHIQRTEPATKDVRKMGYDNAYNSVKEIVNFRCHPNEWRFGFRTTTTTYTATATATTTANAFAISR